MKVFEYVIDLFTFGRGSREKEVDVKIDESMKSTDELTKAFRSSTGEEIIRAMRNLKDNDGRTGS